MTPGFTLAAGAVPPQPWKNGGGQTRELLAGPAGDAWRWRLSLADIARSGPFSAYPGVTRWFAVVQGDGVQLDFPAGPAGPAHSLVLRCGDAPVCFDGALAPGCSLLGGPTRALNLMLRGGAGGLLQRIGTGLADTGTWPLQGWLDASTLCLNGGAPAAAAAPGSLAILIRP